MQGNDCSFLKIASGWLLILAFLTLPGMAQDRDVLNVSDETFQILKQVKNTPLARGKVLLSETTHQDLGWVDEIEKCVVMRDTQWITPFLKRLEEDPAFEMDIEQASIIREYIGRHPGKKGEITQRLKAGRMLVGATYIQPYEEMYFSESLARQLYLGKRWLKEEFDGYDATVYYNADVPGRSLQMPQLLARAGVKSMFLSRHGRGIFDWFSPDGSKVTAYSPGHYIDFYNILGMEKEQALRELAQQALLWSDGYNDLPGAEAVMPAVLNFEFIWDPQPVENLGPFMAFWNGLEKVENEAGEVLEVELPHIQFSTLDKFFQGIRKSTRSFPSIRGERPNVWLYIHGPSHHWALDHSRKADILLPAAEKFAVADAMVRGSFARYPRTLFQEAWESKIYPDHGWGGKGGQSTDDVFLMHFARAHEMAERLLDQSIRSLASKVAVNEKRGIPLVVFNSLSWERTSPVMCRVKFDPQQARSVRLFSKDGKKVPVQLEKVKAGSGGFLQSAEIHFVAENVPSVGFDTYYLKYSEEERSQPETAFQPVFENEFYRAEFSDGGISRLKDKELDKELIDPGLFKAGEVFTLRSEGNGAGEFIAIQQPTMEGFDKTGNYDTHWEVTASGPVFNAYKFRQPIRDAVAEVEVIFYHQVKKIDFLVAVKNWNGTMFREYRMALPLNMEEGQVAYEVPYGVVEVGKDEIDGAAGERYTLPCSESRPRGIENWISASGNGFGVTLASGVVAMDYLNPVPGEGKQTILQPVLLASRRSCHGEGNDYHQTGHHHYSFSITSHHPGWDKGASFGKAANEHLFAVVRPEKGANASLDERTSFLQVAQENIVVTAMKKAENEAAVVLRFFNLEGEPSKADFSLFKPFGKGYETNLIEEEINPLPLEGGTHFQSNVGKYEIKTVKLK